MGDYICKIATLDDVIKKYDYEIENAIDDKDNWIIWKEKAIDRTKNGLSVTYCGVLDNEIICETTAALDPSIVQNSDGLIDDKTVYLYAFRTNEGYHNKGYFSKLFKFMMEDLKSRGYKRATLGVEPEEERNRAIYSKYGFNEYIKSELEEYPDGTKIKVDYYAKDIT